MAKPQTIFRIDGANQHYTIISNAMLQDSRLSHQTKGLLCELLSRPADWEITIRGIVATGKSGRDKVYKMIAEATKLGYIAPDRERRADGTHGPSYYTVRDHCKPLPEKPEVEPLPEKPLPGNPPQQNKEYNKIQKHPLRARARDFIRDDEGLRGAGFALTWPQIDLTAELCRMAVADARLLAEALALEWCQGKPPKSALATLRRAMREEQSHREQAAPKRQPKQAAPPAPIMRRAGGRCDHGFELSSCSVCRREARRLAETPRSLQ